MNNQMDFLIEWFGECAFEESITFSTTTKELTHGMLVVDIQALS